MNYTKMANVCSATAPTGRHHSCACCTRYSHLACLMIFTVLSRLISCIPGIGTFALMGGCGTTVCRLPALMLFSRDRKKKIDLRYNRRYATNT